MVEFQKQIEDRFNQSIEKENVENLQELRNGEFGIPKECKNLFRQAYETLKSVEILQSNKKLIDSCSLLRTCMENIITATIIAKNDEFYEEFKNLTLKDDERKYTIQIIRNQFKHELKQINPELFGKLSNRMIRGMLDEMYNKLCNFTHSSPVVNLAVEMCEDGAEDILNYTIKMISQFLKLLLNSCMCHFIKRESEIDYGVWALLTIFYLADINPEKYNKELLEKYKELISFEVNESLHKAEQKNVDRLKRIQDEFFKTIQEKQED